MQVFSFYCFEVCGWEKNVRESMERSRDTDKRKTETDIKTHGVNKWMGPFHFSKMQYYYLLCINILYFVWAVDCGSIDDEIFKWFIQHCEN